MKRKILLMMLILCGLLLVSAVKAQTTVSSVNLIEISPTQIITSVACKGCVGGTSTGQIDSNGCIIYSCPLPVERMCQNSPPCVNPINKGVDSNGCIIWECPSVACTLCVGGKPTGKLDANGCPIYSCPSDKRCSSDADCGDVKKCLDGTTYRERVCKNNVCEQLSFTGGTPCFNEAVKCSSDADCGDVKKCLDGTTYRERVCKNNVCEEISFTGGTPCYNEKKTCPVGCTCSEDTTTCPVEGIKPVEAKIFSSESGVKSVTINKVTSGLSLQSEKATAVTTEKLIIEENKLSLKTTAGNKEIKILPEEASSKATAITEVSTIELKEESQQPIYSVKGTKQARLFFVIPVSVQIETKVSAESGSVISVKKPWWSFLAW